jgi:CHAD domain-containing protein
MVMETVPMVITTDKGGKPVMASKVDEGFSVYGAEIISKHLEALKSEIEGVRQAQDIEYIHRMRVASRRLRSALPLFEASFSAKRYPGWVKSLRKITRSLGTARDIDVQLGELEKFSEKQTSLLNKPGLIRLKLRLNQQRARAQENILKTLDDLDREGVLVELGKALTANLEHANLTYPFTPTLYQKSYEAISVHLEELLNFEPFVNHPEAATELHAMRIAAKKLRYTLEIFSQIYPGELKSYIQAVRKIQDELGELHDCDFWITFLAEFLQKEYDLTLEYYGHARPYRRLVAGIQAFEADREQSRQAHYLKFVEFWDKTTAEDLWNNLQSSIRIPYFQGESQPSQPPEPKTPPQAEQSQ